MFLHLFTEGAVSSLRGHIPFKQLCSLLHSPWSPIKTCIKQRSSYAPNNITLPEVIDTWSISWLHFHKIYLKWTLSACSLVWVFTSWLNSCTPAGPTLGSGLWWSSLGLWSQSAHLPLLHWWSASSQPGVGPWYCPVSTWFTVQFSAFSCGLSLSVSVH